MKTLLTAACALALAATTALAAGEVKMAEPKPAPAALTNPEAAALLKTQKDKASYSIGQNFGRSMKDDNVGIDVDLLARGMKDALAGKALMTDEEMQATMVAFQEEMMKKQMAKMKEEGDKNKKVENDFLAANAKKEGVKATASGLQYKVVKEGTGATPKVDDIVKVHYRGTLLNGNEFDSSYQRKEPAIFPLNQVIPGWTEGIQLMKVGGKYMLYIPAALAYGERAPSPEVGPNATLVFEVELLGIEPKPATDVKPGEAKKPAK